MHVKTVGNMNFYAGQSATLYDAFFPELDEQELHFYMQHIASCPQPALELGCGTGRILLPLLARGLAVEGCDLSPEMLAICKAKAAKQNLSPVLYHQAIQDLALPKKYGCIFSPLGTFGQMHRRADAQAALQKWYDHLLPGGKLVIYLHLPWYNAPAFGEVHQHEPVCFDDAEIIVYEKSFHDPIEQLIFSTYRYEVKRKGVVVSSEEKEMTVRWYSRYEFVMMLEQAGFKEITVSAGYDDNGPFDVMLFCGVK